VPESARAGRPTPNPFFLLAERLIEDVLSPCARVFSEHTGVIILELPPVPRDWRLEPAEFVERLDAFLDALPREFRYAVELRDRRLLTRSYASVLARHGVAHTYNYWSAMPSIAAQAEVVPPSTAPFTITRLLLRPGSRYEDQREAFQPFDRIVAPDHAMRGEVAGLLDRALRARQHAFVLVNNKAEGSSPLTIRALVEQFFDRWQHAAGDRATPGDEPATRR
jgi:uncharacterized protein YecE (DUF72 family)